MVFPLRKFYTEQMFALVLMKLRNHVDTQIAKRFKGYAIYIYDIKFGLLLVRENEISLRKRSDGTASLRGSTDPLRLGISTNPPLLLLKHKISQQTIHTGLNKLVRTYTFVRTINTVYHRSYHSKDLEAICASEGQFRSPSNRHRHF